MFDLRLLKCEVANIQHRTSNRQNQPLTPALSPAYRGEGVCRSSQRRVTPSPTLPSCDGWSAPLYDSTSFGSKVRPDSRLIEVGLANSSPNSREGRPVRARRSPVLNAAPRGARVTIAAHRVAASLGVC